VFSPPNFFCLIIFQKKKKSYLSERVAYAGFLGGWPFLSFHLVALFLYPKLKVIIDCSGSQKSQKQSAEVENKYTSISIQFNSVLFI